ncbi:IclR family transcriptional regulator [Bordetella holmesii]|uniref:Transcriptional regulator, IclR family, C-terminal domain protein n=2 Tax=Bordetella holmesii TaxID=35814 RepID=A0A158M1C2_9BORD|nr:IclR family transcriptional regulator [Bordetella holmesii]AHV93525.1 bacterial transcriptional regulator family protein [Bordetella holmesii ATCC 51541]AIT26317.1 bacterial transcriptional regulator family protein [Bordetella holmesii 44057]EWM43173.1 bacterial transcriptional regulator family protein [Bordetella holmesii 41130]EWM46889.1 bacterial transcriptional regulator family protein [Bordetella holmesii 35009]EWM51062.1 bacterial transcriptional regulator family protein [Bordetella h
MPATDDDPLYIASLGKSMQVLEAFRHAHDSLGLTDLVRLTGLGKSSVQRIVHSWERLGYLDKSPQSRRYVLGPRVVELGYYFLRSDRLISQAAPHLVALRERCGLAVNMSVLDGQDMIYLLRLPSRQLTLAEMLPGRRMPAWCNSAGRMLLTPFDDDTVARFLAQSDIQPYTPRTTTDLLALGQTIAQARRDGHALTQDQVLLNQVGAAVLLRQVPGQARAAINVTASATDYPLARLTQEIVPLLLQTAYAISSTL